MFPFCDVIRDGGDIVGFFRVGHEHISLFLCCLDAKAKDVLFRFLETIGVRTFEVLDEHYPISGRKTQRALYNRQYFVVITYIHRTSPNSYKM